MKVTIFDLTFLALLLFKLAGIINWSWWWVTAPLWGPILVAAVIWTVVAIASRE